MRDTRLIFVEGIMGSGKSTIAEFVADQLSVNGIPNAFVAEDGRVDETVPALRIARYARTVLNEDDAVWLDSKAWCGSTRITARSAMRS